MVYSRPNSITESDVEALFMTILRAGLPPPMRSDALASDLQISEWMTYLHFAEPIEL